MKRVLVGGCFDLIHFGHITFLQNAQAQGDYLIIALESDENVRRRKGNNRPIHTQKERAEMLKSLRMVDEVVELPVMTSDTDYEELVKKIKPDVIAVTEDDPYLDHKKRQAETIGSQLVVVSPLVKNYSTSLLLQEI
jgi:FAD synthetase